MINDWGSDELYRFDSSLLYTKGLREDTFYFLSTVGLPTSAAPFLGFADNDLYKELENIYSIYVTGEPKHQNLLCIGSNGAGDPICIDLNNGCRIVALNHEEGFSPSFMNSSVVELFQFLTTFKSFGEEIIITNGEDAFLDANFTDMQFNELKEVMEAIDEEALAGNTFWVQELELLLENREYFLKRK